MLARLFFGALVLASLAVAREQRQLGAELDEALAGARPKTRAHRARRNARLRASASADAPAEPSNCLGQNWTCLSNAASPQMSVAHGCTDGAGNWGTSLCPATGGSGTVEVCPYALYDTDAGCVGGITYNDFSLPNLGYCKMQNLGDPARLASGLSDTQGPKLLTQNRVSGGAGLAGAQFNYVSSVAALQFTDGQIACGMCIEATVAAPVTPVPYQGSYGFAGSSNCDASAVAWGAANTSTLLLIVMDQCNDASPQCPSGHLDLDIYQSAVGGINSNIVSWRAVECPVGDDITIALAFNTQLQNGVYQLPSQYYFSFNVWDMRVPIASISVLCADKTSSVALSFQTANGWTCVSPPYAAYQGGVVCDGSEC